MRNGKAVAIAYPLEKTGWKNPNSYNNTKKSSEVESWAAYDNFFTLNFNLVKHSSKDKIYMQA